MNPEPSCFHQKTLRFAGQTPGVSSKNPWSFIRKSQAIQERMPGIWGANSCGFLPIYSPLIKVLQLYSISC